MDYVLFEKDIDLEIKSIREQFNAIGNNKICYSETTVFPPRAMRRENLVKKLKWL